MESSKGMQIGSADNIQQVKVESGQSSSMIHQSQAIIQAKPSQHASNNGHNPSISYRPDIDGLRTIAVGIVVIFHAWPSLIPGGYIGVDIFFVISGYLITQILIKENLKNKFTYFNFYNRRVKRIYPALLMVLMFVFYIGIRHLNPQRLKIMTSTMAASTVFGANIQILTQQNDYFDPDTKTNPLLHLWSLGVQQQFYIFWPFIISLLVTKFSSKALKLLVGFTVLSLIANLIVVHINSQFDFYFPFTRFWQMAVGGLLAFKAVTITDARIANILSLSGIAIVLIFSLLLSEEFLYPGWWAIFPTLGSALIIQAGSESLANKHLLSTRPMVFVGKISYSLYLWHWPLLVFSRLLYPEGSTSIFAKTYVMVLLAVAFSIASYYLIENPMRFAKQRYIFHVLLLIMLCMGLSALYVHNKILPEQQIFQTFETIQTSVQVLDMKQQFQLGLIPTANDFIEINGITLPNSSKNKQRQLPTYQKLQFSIKHGQPPWSTLLLEKRINQKSKYYKKTIPRQVFHYQVLNQGQQKLVLCVGDSHAQMAHRYMKLYEDAVKNNKTNEFPTVVVIVISGSILAPGRVGYQFIMNWIEQFRPQRVLFIYRWQNWNKSNSNPVKKNIKYFNENVGFFAQAVKKFTQKGIYITTNTFKPEGPQFNPNNMIDNNGIIQSNVKPIKLSQYKEGFKLQIDFLEKQVKKAGGKIIDFTNNQCWNDICQVLAPSGFNIYADMNHYSTVFTRNWASVMDFLVEF